jgi:hypothetical protein
MTVMRPEALAVLIAGCVALPAAADVQGSPVQRPPGAEATPEWPPSGTDPELPLPPMAPAAAASRLTTPWFGIRAGVGGRLPPSGADPLARPMSEIVRLGPSVTVDAGLRLRGYWVPFVAFRHETLGAGSALVRGTSVSDDALGLGSRWYWSWSTRQRVQLFAELRALAGILRFAGSGSSSGSYFEWGPSAGVEVRLDRRWSAGLGLAYSMMHLGTSVTPTLRDPTPLRPAPPVELAPSWSVVAEVHFEPR